MKNLKMSERIGEIKFRADYSEEDFLDEAKGFEHYSGLFVPSDKKEELADYWVALMNNSALDFKRRGSLMGFSLKPFIEEMPGRLRRKFTGSVRGLLPFSRKK